jgi:hypothetical protein
MQVTNEIREAFLFAVLNLVDEWQEKSEIIHGTNSNCPNVQSGEWTHCKGHTRKELAMISRKSAAWAIRRAFESTDTEQLMPFLTLQEKVAFGRKLLELTGGRDLTSDLTEDR